MKLSMPRQKKVTFQWRRLLDRAVHTDRFDIYLQIMSSIGVICLLRKRKILAHKSSLISLLFNEVPETSQASILSCMCVLGRLFSCIQWVQLRWEVIVCFIDIRGIDDHHYVYFLFIILTDIDCISALPRGLSKTSWRDK